MAYATLSACVNDLRAHGHLRVVDYPVDPKLEMACVQRRAFLAKAPALLFTRPKGCAFPMLANLFGTRERLKFIFRDSIKSVEALLRARANPKYLARHPLEALKILPALAAMRPRLQRAKSAAASGAPVLARRCALGELPKLVSWPRDGGPFITLPLVYTQAPGENGHGNLGMYRIQLSGNAYLPDEAGMHYQLKRGIGVHHARAIASGHNLPVHVHVGGPPALTVAAVMPLPEGLSELLFAGALGCQRTRLCQPEGFHLPVLAECDFLLKGEIIPQLKPEGPFGDHMGYYSLRHDFPVMKVDSVWHRENAIWPFTVVGRPPQEDTVFGDFIHELTAPLLGQVFEGVKEVNAVDAAGVHPLLLALGSERYTAYEARRKPRELLSQAMNLLGTTQTSLAKFLLIAASEDAPALSARDVRAFFSHMLERADFGQDLHFLTGTTADTLDYACPTLNEGSKLIWASAGEKRRSLGLELTAFPDLPRGFGNPGVVAPGILAINGPAHARPAGAADPCLEELGQCLSIWPMRESFPLVAVVDDAAFCAASFENFLWVTFTRTDPATDSYGAFARIEAKHWSCQAPLILDARSKAFHAPVLEEDPETARRVEDLAAAGGPLAGIF